MRSRYPAELATTPFHSFIFKIASRCNINCSYCFVYNKADQKWKDQPSLMAPETAKAAATNIRRHCEAFKKSDAEIIFHGGEPLLGGVRHLEKLVREVRSAFAESDIHVRLGMQTNGLLLSPDIIRFLAKESIQIGISIDGPPHLNDKWRVDHRGEGTGARLHARLIDLVTSEFKHILSGFLIVVDLDSDPSEILDYVAQFSPRGIDFLLPYDNHDIYPRGKISFSDHSYGRWLTRAFDYWYERYPEIRLKEFDGILRMLFGGSSGVESIGLGAVDLIVVETNGDIEAVDSLKAAFNGATSLGLNIFKNEFVEAAKNIAVRQRHLGAEALCGACQDCSIVTICGGGYLPNRYSATKGFNNPSVYCHDLAHLISHIDRRVAKDLRAQDGSGA